ncbi:MULTISPECIES: hypothetical protein [unclassified Leptolyngbya]|uniref:hypothetical protein n=1 Tax=unclassified Leptolyngbya TaxID=2650499 RepID=UPI001686C0D6|nr:MULTISPECIES: hypothetical protein [unclassified Leptolyngbya]MBD1909195.1 hypothetical protein [Leptolyngbya sp. FACHB-8]MBD2152952.1 hypothetical protein [Leptolyngbya sp. FACHB-16]
MRYKLPFLCICLGIVASIAFPASGVPTLSTTSTTVSTSLDLDGEGNASTHIVKVADITIATHNSRGFTLTLTSASLTKSDGNDIDLQITTVSNDAGVPSNGDFTVPSGHTYTYVTETDGSENRDVYIRYTPDHLQDPGTYSASIRISVVDN